MVSSKPPKLTSQLLSKKLILIHITNQLIATNIVASFTENGLNPVLNPLVPSIMMSAHRVLVSLYDCVNDVLLLSPAIDLLQSELWDENSGEVYVKGSSIVQLHVRAKEC